ncbi:murein L,D-transpeptidase [Pararhizobium sp. IMCC21322]|uniref:L,D-transpeptidase family protein n=1 Tax=Pararhizobium sp. IMCC21322 TaxID=3067903 RepID=UPI00274299F3|nr:L,D-transpeptidase family protein [Pararhizobium sp. IMCC21322]
MKKTTLENMIAPTRRAVLGGLASTVAMPAILKPAFAQSEWGESFDNQQANVQGVRTNRPVLNPQAPVEAEWALQQYSSIMSRGGWNTVPADTTLKLGLSSPNVAALRQRLIISGDLQQSIGISNSFDSYVDEAVKRFQARHGIEPDGVAGEISLAALNVPVDVRVRQLQTNMVRLQSLSGDKGRRFINVNLPAARIEAVESGQVVSWHTAVVGKVDRQSPVLNSKVYQINFNPYWTVPVSIIRKDMIPQMQKDPGYLTNNRIRIYDKGGSELQPTQIDWLTEEAVNYRFRQDPGEGNSLGSIRINFHNEHAVYLHDTPAKGLFGEEYRFNSSGCVRVQNIKELAAWILNENDGGWTFSSVNDTILTGERRDENVKNQVPIYITYITAWAMDGVVHFRDDIYTQDGVGPLALR